MTQARFQVVPAAYLVLRRHGSRGEEVLLQRREGTTYMDGWWACAAAGHVEPGESVVAAGVREAREELGLDLRESDLEPLATLHRTCATHDPLEERFDIFFGVRRWEGEPRISEPDKAAELGWFPLDDLPDRVVPHERTVLEALRRGETPAVLTHGFGQTLTLVAAVGRGGVIGDGTSMPWHLPEDLAHFKRITLGGVMVMGRGTWDSIGRALPGRRTIVLTRNRDWSAQDAEVAHSLPEALLMAGDHEVFVVGGGQIYAQTIDHATRLVITEVHQASDADVRFPRIDPAVWREVTREPHDGFAFVTWGRRGADAAARPA